MARPAPSERDQAATTLAVPASVRLPVELTPPDEFDAVRPETWPHGEGRLEWVAGRLLWMPPCGGRQGATVLDLAGVLSAWVRAHPGFVAATNEAGMHLGGDVRAADVAVWRRADFDPTASGFATAPPLLAAEVAGQHEGESALRDKARWYLAHGVVVVWLLLPETREVLVLRPVGESRHGLAERLPPHAALPDLAPGVDELLRQVVG